MQELKRTMVLTVLMIVVGALVLAWLVKVEERREYDQLTSDQKSVYDQFREETSIPHYEIMKLSRASQLERDRYFAERSGRARFGGARAEGLRDLIAPHPDKGLREEMLRAVDFWRYGNDEEGRWKDGAIERVLEAEATLYGAMDALEVWNKKGEALKREFMKDKGRKLSLMTQFEKMEFLERIRGRGVEQAAILERSNRAVEDLKGARAEVMRRYGEEGVLGLYLLTAAGRAALTEEEPWPKSLKVIDSRLIVVPTRKEERLIVTGLLLTDNTKEMVTRFKEGISKTH